MSTGQDLVARARHLAAAAHAGQYDKAGEPYIGHPARVAADIELNAPAPVRDNAVAVAWLHDVVEDTDVTLTEIRTRFGSIVADAVGAITHRRHEPRAAYYRRVAANPLALLVKVADIADNTNPDRLAALDEPTRQRLHAKYEKALEALLALEPVTA
ncbi:HD domain-containing protein [Pseudactinotalea terrae]|uniref:HD domain-containing protein n=1 Tax=Pseudactinotalea terrae TaxID=1743262 RepID=UPI0012E30474|nr:HD domain-containing protein [Pseudactinotalea terrae]